MEAVARQKLCGDYLNIFGCEDLKFHWSKEYSDYSSPPTQKYVIWTSRISRAGCVPEVFDY
jgi:hypothetical protein